MKPFLKWAGNKYQIIERLKSALPAGKRLIEPFVGSGAVFLNTNYEYYLLSDANQDLIDLYQYLQAQREEFIDYSRQFFTVENNTEEQFYHWRTVFNTTEDARLKSALFIYLNKHCFNGLCRYNSKKLFNTPFGRYKSPYFPAAELSYFYKHAQKAIFTCSDFIETMLSAEPGDVVYCDPPYVPLSKTASFTSFSAGGFTEQQQIALADTAKKLAANGVTVLLSNHATDFTKQLYEGAEISLFDVQRFISSNGAKREKAAEILAVFK